MSNADPIVRMERSEKIVGAFSEIVRKVGTIAELRGFRIDQTGGERISITARPQRAVAIRRLVIAGDPSNWVVHELRIGGVVHASNVPGSAFGSSASPALMINATANEGVNIELIVGFVGKASQSDGFYGSLICESPGSRGMTVIPMISQDGVRLRPLSTSVLFHIEESAWQVTDERQLDPAPGGAAVITPTTNRSAMFSDHIEPVNPADEWTSKGLEREVPRKTWTQLVLSRSDGVTRQFLPASSGPAPGQKTVDIRDAWSKNRDMIYAVSRRVVALHVAFMPDITEGGDRDEVILFGADEHTGDVLFEVRVTAGDFVDARFDAFGYVPAWWERFQAMQQDLREKAG